MNSLLVLSTKGKARIIATLYIGFHLVGYKEKVKVQIKRDRTRVTLTRTPREEKRHNMKANDEHTSIIITAYAMHQK